MDVYPLSLPLDDTRYSIVPDYFLNVALSLQPPASCLPQGVLHSGML